MHSGPCSRRHMARAIACTVAAPPLASFALVAYAQEGSTQSERLEWMDAVIGERTFDSPSIISKFSDEVFYIRSPIRWSPSNKNSNLPSVVVPEGFVTDLTSIPRLFWSVLPRDGKYADAAIVHDYLYWMQPVSKDAADAIFAAAMKDLEVAPLVVAALYSGVRTSAGVRAWRSNSALRTAGERRVLKKYPSSPNTSWIEWKQANENLDEKY